MTWACGLDLGWGLAALDPNHPSRSAKAIRELPRLRKQYGPGRWRKLKGAATVKLTSGRVRRAEVHWYEAHGIGRKEIKRKRYLD